jgi:hypothetical protein
MIAEPMLSVLVRLAFDMISYDFEKHDDYSAFL